MKAHESYRWMNQPGVLQGLGHSTICEYVAVWMTALA